MNPGTITPKAEAAPFFYVGEPNSSKVDGIEVTDGTPADWLAASVGYVIAVPHVRTEKVVQLTGAVPQEWALAS